MRHGKTTALKCLPLATELLIVFLTADILWQLLCGRPPFSMWGFLLSGGLMTAGNSLFLQKAPPLLADSAAERPPLRRLDPPAQPHAGPDLSASSGDSGAPVPLPPVPGIPLGRHACHGPPPPRGRGVHGPVWAVLSDRGLLRPSASGPGAGSVGAAGAGSAGSGGDAHLRPQHHSGRFSLRAASCSAGPSGPGLAGCGRLRSAAGRQGGS